MDRRKFIRETSLATSGLLLSSVFIKRREKGGHHTRPKQQAV